MHEHVDMIVQRLEVKLLSARADLELQRGKQTTTTLCVGRLMALEEMLDWIERSFGQE